ncbi:hypothetical protein CMI48_00930 [Candidatus Pacearchaeota archaeon]|nr:hypothetical protein [Candidatus Pacearchaeota archaeon]
MGLAEFLVLAKINGYATGGEGRESKLEDGGKELKFSEGDLSYRDKYYGFDPFSGEEIVWKGGEIIWSMNYYGGVDPDHAAIAKKIYEFLKKVLEMVGEASPFRGPEKFTEGDFSYENSYEGDIEKFKGSERILLKGKEVYSLEYHGGLIKQKG